MNRQAMVDSLDIRFGGALSRIVGANPGRIDTVLNEAQRMVADDMVQCHGALEVFVAGSDDEEGVRPTLAGPLPDITSSADCTLPECYHLAVLAAAERILAKMMGDNVPTFKAPTKLWQEYQEALNRAHKVYALQLNSTTPNRVMDAYAPGRHYEEDF